MKTVILVKEKLISVPLVQRITNLKLIRKKRRKRKMRKKRKRVMISSILRRKKKERTLKKRKRRSLEENVSTNQRTPINNVLTVRSGIRKEMSAVSVNITVKLAKSNTTTVPPVTQDSNLSEPAKAITNASTGS